MSNELKIEVTIKTVYGNETIYPVCDKAKLFAAIAKQKTLTTKEIRLIKELGYTVFVVPAFPTSL